MGPTDKFNEEKEYRIKELSDTLSLKKIANDFIIETARYKYSYNFPWLDPIIQFPQDIIAMQEIIWKVKPDLSIESGYF